jgi:hypothetical protein
VSAGFLSGIDSYMYVSPVSQISPPTPADTEATADQPDQATSGAPVPAGDGVVEHASPR